MAVTVKGNEMSDNIPHPHSLMLWPGQQCMLLHNDLAAMGIIREFSIGHS